MTTMTTIETIEAENIDGGGVLDALRFAGCVAAVVGEALTGKSFSEAFC